MRMFPMKVTSHKDFSLDPASSRFMGVLDKLLSYKVDTRAFGETVMGHLQGLYQIDQERHKVKKRIE